MGHFIDLATWKRREHFELYRRYANPFFSLGADVDASAAWRTRKKPGQSFFLATVFHALTAANSVEAFRRRVRGDGVWVHDTISIGPTVMRSDETFGFVRLEPAHTLAEFSARSSPALEHAREVRPLVVTYPDDDVVYHSSLPWIRFTSFSNALNGGADSVPRIVFGKCVREGNRMMLPVGVEVHHAVVDGLDVARFLEAFEGGLASA